MTFKKCVSVWKICYRAYLEVNSDYYYHVAGGVKHNLEDASHGMSLLLWMMGTGLVTRKATTWLNTRLRTNI